VKPGQTVVEVRPKLPHVHAFSKTGGGESYHAGAERLENRGSDRRESALLEGPEQRGLPLGRKCFDVVEHKCAVARSLEQPGVVSRGIRESARAVAKEC